MTSFRLVSQAAAQDVRAKLHGRTIRGYSDRLQVFFEDEFAARLVNEDRNNYTEHLLITNHV